MQWAYRPIASAPGRPPAVQRVAYPDGVPIADVAARMGWFVDPPAEHDVLDEHGALMQDAYRPDVEEPVTAAPTTAEPIRSPKAAPPELEGEDPPEVKPKAAPAAKPKRRARRTKGE